MKGVQCYELFGGIALKNHAFSFQGSVLGPMFFTMYINPLFAIIDSHSIMHHSFADENY